MEWPRVWGCQGLLGATHTCNVPVWRGVSHDIPCHACLWTLETRSDWKKQVHWKYRSRRSNETIPQALLPVKARHPSPMSTCNTSLHVYISPLNGPCWEMPSVWRFQHVSHAPTVMSLDTPSSGKDHDSFLSVDTPLGDSWPGKGSQVVARQECPLCVQGGEVR